MKTSSKDRVRMIEALRKTGGKDIGEHRKMLIDLIASEKYSQNGSNPKQLRKFLDLILTEIDKRKAMRGI